MAAVLTAVVAAGAYATAGSPGSAGPAPPPTPGPRAGHRGPASVTQEGVFTLLYGDDHCFGLAPPKGWVLDDTSGLGNKIRVVAYPKGEKWKTASVVMYVNPIHQEDRAHPRPLLEMVERDVNEFKTHSPHGVVTTAESIKTKKGQSAEVRYFAESPGDPQEAVAYFMEKDLVMLIVLSGRKPGAFKQSLPAFHDMVASYEFVAGNIHTPTTPTPAPKAGKTVQTSR